THCESSTLACCAIPFELLSRTSRRPPDASHFRHVPLRTGVKFPASPSPHRPLFLLDRDALFAEVDLHATWLLLRLINLIAEHRDGHDERADDEIEDVVAVHRSVFLGASFFEGARRAGTRMSAHPLTNTPSSPRRYRTSGTCRCVPG